MWSSGSLQIVSDKHPAVGLVRKIILNFISLNYTTTTGKGHHTAVDIASDDILCNFNMCN